MRDSGGSRTPLSLVLQTSRPPRTLRSTVLFFSNPPRFTTVANVANTTIGVLVIRVYTKDVATTCASKGYSLDFHHYVARWGLHHRRNLLYVFSSFLRGFGRQVFLGQHLFTLVTNVVSYGFVRFGAPASTHVRPALPTFDVVVAMLTHGLQPL